MTILFGIKLVGVGLKFVLCERLICKTNLYFLIMSQAAESQMVQYATAELSANIQHGLALILKHNLKEKQMVP